MRSRWAICGLLAMLAGPVAAEPVAGTVLGPAGQPTAGVSVWLMAAPGGEIVTQGPLTTGADGSFSGEIETDQQGLVAVLALGEQAVGGFYGIANDALRLAMVPLTTVMVQVDDGEGRPLAGARFTYELMRLPAAAEGAVSEAVSFSKTNAMGEPPVSGADGKLAVRLPVGGMARGSWTADGRVRLPRFEVADGPVPAAVSLPREGALAGRVVDGAGQPVAGALLEAVPAAAATYNWATSAADGTFRVGGLLADTYRLVCRPPDGVASIYVPREELVVTTGAECAVPDLAPTPGVPVTIVFRVDGSDERVSGVRVWAEDETAANLPLSGDDGRVVGQLLPGPNTLRVGDDTLPPPFVLAEAYEFRLVVDPAQPPAPFEVVLRRGVMLRGRVQDEAGRPVAGLELQGQTETTERYGISAADGRFTLGPFLPGEPCLVGTSEWLGDEPITHRLTPREPRVVEADGPELSWTLEEIPTTTVSGRVLTTGGAPLPGVTVLLVPGYRAWADNAWTDGEPWEAVTDEAGTYQFDGFRTAWELDLRLAGGGFRLVQAAACPPDDERQPPLQATPFVVEPLTGEAAGVVVDDRGRPAAGAMVYALGQRPDEPLVTGEDGRFALRGLFASTKVVIALRGEREYGRAVLAGGDVTIRLAPVAAAATMPVAERHLLAVRALEQAWRREPSPKLISRMARVDALLAAEKVTELTEADRYEAIPDLLEIVAERDPAEAANLGSLLDLVPHSIWRAATAAMLARRVLPVDAAAARHWQARAVAWSSAPGMDPVATAGVLVLLDDALGDHAAADRRAAALLAFADAVPEMQARRRIGAARAMADDPARAVPMLTGWGPDDDLNRARTDLLVSMAVKDPRAALAQFQTWYGPGPFVRLNFDCGDGDQCIDIAVVRAALVLAERLAPVDAGAALALALQIGETYHREVALIAVLPYLTGDDAGVAAGALLDASRKPRWTGASELTAGPLAARALLAVQPELAATMFKQQSAAAIAGNHNLDEPCFDVGFCLAGSRPNQARDLIERGFARLGDGTNRAWKLGNAIQALCALSVEDALALAALYPEEDGGLVKVADWLLLDDALRATRPRKCWAVDWDGNTP